VDGVKFWRLWCRKSQVAGRKSQAQQHNRVRLGQQKSATGRDFSVPMFLIFFLIEFAGTCGGVCACFRQQSTVQLSSPNGNSSKVPVVSTPVRQQSVYARPKW
jgi:hypothetical protein